MKRNDNLIRALEELLPSIAAQGPSLPDLAATEYQRLAIAAEQDALAEIRLARYRIAFRSEIATAKATDILANHPILRNILHDPLDSRPVCRARDPLA